MNGAFARYARYAGLFMLCAVMTGCSSSLYGWQVRTNSVPMSQSFRPADLNEHPIALFRTVTVPVLKGNEVSLSYYLGQILQKIGPNWTVVLPHGLINRLNQKGLIGEYVRMRADYEMSDIFDGIALRKIASAIGVRYVFQPQLGAFSQTMTDRWSFPPVDLRMMQTRSSIMRMSLQLWDAESGEIVWASMAEATMQMEGISQDPVYLEDIARATLGSMIADLINGKTASTYTPVNKFLNNLIEEAVPSEKPEEQKITVPGKTVQ